MKDIKDESRKILEFIENIGLGIISISTLIAFGFEVSSMIEARVVTLADLLLMFIYLEVLAMVAIYLDSGKLPVRMPLYIAIVALARYLVLDMKNLESMHLIAIGGTILIVAISVFVLRYGHCNFPYDDTHKN